ncbi:MAG: hypothetical protein MMC23_003843 [Stictis urceolatum]|nr:hypothetical protein [Stictis urceolata]
MPYLPNMTFPMLDEQSNSRRMSAIGTAMPLVGKSKPVIDIALKDDQSGAFVPSYTTLEKIQGEASITCPAETQYQDIHIIFQGAAKTYVEKIATSAPTTPRTQAYHNFLRLTQPMENAGIPEDNIAREGVTYKIPFTFVVPEKLLPQACTHKKENEAVLDSHLQLPPSFGDPMMASDGKTLRDDLAPNMTVISYAIRVIITRPPKNANSRPGVVADSMKKLRIIPRTEEQPPLRVSPNSEDDYILEKSKTVKRGMFKGKHGTLTMSAPQPAPLRLPYHNSTSTCPTTTMATVELRFDPADAKSKPPRLGSLMTKLKAATFYATTPLRDYPSKSNAYLYDSQRGIFVESLPLSSRCVESAQWTAQEPPLRRDSAISIPQTPLPADTLPYYTSRILVPVDLPTNTKSFVPTFHSCLVSRVYALDMVLTAHSPSSVGGTTNLHIKLPLQIASEGNPDARPVISPEEAASIARREADQAWVPRSFAPPPPSEGSGGGSPELRGARGSIFVSPRWGSVSDEEGGGRRGSELGDIAAVLNGNGNARRGSSPIQAVQEEDDLPPGYSALVGSGRRAVAT